jgi:transposase
MVNLIASGILTLLRHPGVLRPFGSEPGFTCPSGSTASGPPTNPAPPSSPEILDISLKVVVMSIPVAPLALSDADRAELGRLAESGPARLAERARIVLACADPAARGNSGVAAALGLSANTVRKWRERFAASGVAGLADSPRPGRPKARLVLTDAEREQLQRWARRATTSQALARRAKIVLACAEGKDNKAVAAESRTTEHTVARWRGGFTRKRLDGLHDQKRPGRPPSVLLDRVEEVVTATRGTAQGRHALVEGLDGQAQRTEQVHRRADLAQVRPQAPPQRYVQAVTVVC